MFVILAVIMILSSIGTVVTKSIIRAATYLLFVLLGTAGMYFLMGYTFLGAVQTMVYAGGIIVLYVFAILLTEGKDGAVKSRVKDASWGLILTLVGFLVFVGVLFKQNYLRTLPPLALRRSLLVPQPIIQSTKSAPSCFQPMPAAICFPSRQSVCCSWHVSWQDC